VPGLRVSPPAWQARDVVAHVQHQQRLNARCAHRDLGGVCWLRQGTTQTHTRQRSWREVEEAPVEEELFFYRYDESELFLHVE